MDAEIQETLTRIRDFAAKEEYEDGAGLKDARISSMGTG